MNFKTTALEESGSFEPTETIREQSSKGKKFVNKEGDDNQPMPDVVCFSHLRWDFVFQRPQHLLTRFGKASSVFFIEEPIIEDLAEHSLEISTRENNVTVVIPKIKPGRNHEEIEEIQTQLINSFIREFNLERFIAWYYTPMALGFTEQLNPLITVYDCMDELSAFVGAPRNLLEREKQLLQRADLVFTGGYSLYEAKKSLHKNVFAFPSSIELEHFNAARNLLPDPEDQKDIRKPRIGFYGVIDERMDIDLVGGVAVKRPDWQFVFIGPVVKIDRERLPKSSNIHYLGMKSYKELPHYLGNWDVAMLPFALNESTRFISPTKTPEYLAAGKPVVSSAIRDVVMSYGNRGLVNIFNDVDSFIAAVERALNQTEDREWLNNVDEELSTNSWDLTWQKMNNLVLEKIEAKK